MGESERSIGAVLFDYGLVLTGPAEPAARAAMQRVLGADDSVVQAAYWKYRDAYDRGALSGVAYWHAVAGDVGRTLDAASLAAWLKPTMRYGRSRTSR